jgi:hypothetical protein
MPARSVCLVALSLSKAGPGRFGGQLSFTDLCHTMHRPQANLATVHPRLARIALEP